MERAGRWFPREHVVILNPAKWDEESSSTERVKGVPTETVGTRWKIQSPMY